MSSSAHHPVPRVDDSPVSTVPPVIAGTGYRVQIWPVHSQGPSEHEPVKNFGEMGVPKVLKYPLLSQERIKLRTSNFVCTLIGSIGTKAH